MPIEPIENPYKVIHSDRSRRTRHVERRDPEERNEKKFQEEDTFEESEKEPTPGEVKEESPVVEENPPKEPPQKTIPKIDIRI